ncbi:unnamed protein product [marine sediment metagenome]|uniref:Uncharacterized protein n=1 Tax=marine sediment metagenome TaxID=412755 RepID=X1S9V8_9ZZZZ
MALDRQQELGVPEMVVVVEIQDKLERELDYGLAESGGRVSNFN